MEFDLFVPSFPQLQSHFDISPFWVEALLSVNFIGYCLSLFFVGALSDRYGRKPIIMLGLVCFAIGSLLCLSIDAYPALLIGRFLQGLGIAAPAILSFLILADIYSLQQQQFLMAMLNGSLNNAAAIAPVIGSYLTLYYHWQGNFIALLTLGLIALLMTLCFVPNNALARRKEELSAGYGAILQSKPLMLVLINITMICVPYWIFVGMSPLLYIKDLGVSLAHFGYYQGVLALVFALGSIVFGLVIRTGRVIGSKLLYLSNLIFVLSGIAILWVSLLTDCHPLLITLALLIFVIGQIIPSAILYPLSLNVIPEAKGRVSALMQGGRLIFTAISLEIAGYFYTGSFRSIGLIILTFIFLSIITLYFVMKNRHIMAID